MEKISLFRNFDESRPWRTFYEIQVLNQIGVYSRLDQSIKSVLDQSIKSVLEVG